MFSNPSMTDSYLVPTLNKMGYCLSDLTITSKQFVEFAKSTPYPVLDLGAGMGFAAIEALNAGATVVANDIDLMHLQIIWDKATPDQRERLTLIPGKLPAPELFPKDTFSAIHFSQVIHFMTPAEIEDTITLIRDSLREDGKLFLVASTPYIHMLENFVPVFEARKKAGDPWPGQVMLKEYVTNPILLHQIPDFMHVFDHDILRNLFEKKGFIVESCETFKRPNIPWFVALDGRENVGMIARKK